ncbi:MAG: hypothetical protein ACLQL2_13100 [Methylovirgula sp.]
MRVGVFLLSLAGLSLMAPGPSSATPGFVVLSAPRSFTVLGTVENFHPGHRHKHFYDAAIEDAALLTGGFDAAQGDWAPPPDEPAPYQPYPAYYPVYYPPPHYCFHPLVIHLAPEQHTGRLPRVIYGTKPLNCPDE